MSRRILYLIGALVSAGLAASTPAASAAGGRAHPIVENVTFTRDGLAESVISDGGRYAFVNNLAQAAPPGYIGEYSGGRLIDEDTGKSVPVPAAGCYGFLSGGPWVLLDCPDMTPPTYDLYSIPSHDIVSTIAATDGMRPSAIGADWIQYFVVATGAYVFQNISTGTIRTLTGWRPGGTIIPDLSSPTLGHRLCKPLRVPNDWSPYARWSGYPNNEKLHPGTVTFLGRVAALQGTTRPNAAGAYTETSYLEHCGSTLQRPFGGGEQPINSSSQGDYAGNTHTLLGGSGPSLAGYALPSLTPVKVPISLQGVYRPYTIAMTSRHLYLVGPDNVLWVATAPQLAMHR